jgi:hypothetical protein
MSVEQLSSVIKGALDNIRNAMPSDVNIVMSGYTFGPYIEGTTCGLDSIKIM